MNKRERFHAAVNGEEVDRPPVTAWVHFLSDHLDSSQTADLHARFLAAYDWDLLKVMNDYRYPVPEGVVTLEDVTSLLRYKKFSLKEDCFVRQLECLRLLRTTLDPNLPIIETIFEPYQQILRNVGFSQAANLFRHDKHAALEAIQTVTETTCDYIREVRGLGIDGIFLSINGAIPPHRPRGVTPEQHRIYQKNFAIDVLKEAQGMVRVLHVHGDHLDIDRIWDYPCEVISVSDRLQGNPSLSLLRQKTDKCLMGGINETRIQEQTLVEIKSEVDDIIAQVGRNRLIIAPGCTMPSFTPARNLQYLRRYSLTL